MVKYYKLARFNVIPMYLIPIHFDESMRIMQLGSELLASRKKNNEHSTWGRAILAPPQRWLFPFILTPNEKPCDGVQVVYQTIGSWSET